MSLQAFAVYCYNKYTAIGLWSYFHNIFEYILKSLKNVTAVRINVSPGKSLKIFAYELSPMDISIAWPYKKLLECISNI